MIDGIAKRLDSLIFAFSPARGARRIALRRMKEVLEERVDRFRAYSATAPDRMRGHDWLASKLSPDYELKEELTTLRDRSRDMYRNEPFAASAVDGRVNYEVGATGITPRPAIRGGGKVSDAQADAWNEELSSLYTRWSPHASACGCKSMTEMQKIACRTWCIDGEGIGLISNVARADKPIPLAIQVAETSRLETRPQDEAKDEVRLGVRYDKLGRPKSYTFRTAHPNDPIGDYQYEDKPAFDKLGRPLVLHLYEQIWPEQSRGIPWLSPALGRLKDLKEFIEAEIVAAQVAACFSVFVKTTDPEILQAIGIAEYDINSDPIEEVDPGRVHYLKPGEDVQFANPSRPADNFAPWMSWQLRGIAAAISYPYELLVKDYTDTTYSSGRLSLIDGRIGFQSRQEVMIKKFLSPIWRHLVNQAVLTGEVSIPPQMYNEDPARFELCNWVTPGWPWLDPQKEISAAIMAIENNLSTIDDELTQRGKNINDVFTQRAKEVQMINKLDLLSPDQRKAKTEAERPQPQPAGMEN